MWTVKFWLDAAERAIRTFAQALASVWVAAGTGLLDTDWTSSLSVAGMTALISVAMSISGEVVAPSGSASWVDGVRRH